MSVTPSKMRAVHVESPGGPFRLVDLDRPTAKAGQVMVRIEASGVNPLDLKIRSGAAPHARQPLPAVLGMDLAGTVAAVASDVETFLPGDPVYGMVGGVGGLQGTLAQFAAVDVGLLAKKPTALSMKEAASLPLVAITAWEGLVDLMHLQGDGTLLVHGGAGGVGHVAIQLARAFGARVYATGRPSQAGAIAALGATPIDPEAVSVAEYVARHTGGKGFDFILDTIGDDALDAAFEAVAQGGHVVSALGRGRHVLAPLSLKGATYSGLFTLHPLLSGTGRARHGQILGKIADLVDAGQLRPRVDPREYRLETVEDAHRSLAQREASGRIVVSIA